MLERICGVPTSIQEALDTFEINTIRDGGKTVLQTADIVDSAFTTFTTNNFEQFLSNFWAKGLLYQYIEYGEPALWAFQQKPFKNKSLLYWWNLASKLSCTQLTLGFDIPIREALGIIVTIVIVIIGFTNPQQRNYFP